MMQVRIPRLDVRGEEFKENMSNNQGLDGFMIGKHLLNFLLIIAGVFTVQSLVNKE